MDRIALLWLFIGIAAGSAIFHTEISDAVYSIPPTSAWANFTIGGINIEADSYKDEFEFIAGAGITLTPDAINDALTIASTGGGGGGSGGASNQTASYIIIENNTHAFAINGSTGIIDFTSDTMDVVFQSAIDSLNNGGLVFVKEGVYDFSNYGLGVTPININNDNVFLTGEGWGSIINYTGEDFAITIGAVNGGGITNLGFTGNDTDSGNGFIKALGTVHGTVKGNYMEFSGDEALELTGTRFFDIVNNHFFNVSMADILGQAISLQVGANDTTVSFNEIQNTNGKGINVGDLVGFTPPTRTTIANNNIDNARVCIRLGVTDTNMTDFTIDANTMNDCAKDGIHIDGSATHTVLNVAISGNVITGGGTDSTGRAAIRCEAIEYDSNISVTSNIVRGFGQDGSLTTSRGIEGCNIMNSNTVSYSNGHGIVVSEPFSVVMGNICINNGESGSGDRAGISVGGNADNSRIIGNSCTDTRAQADKEQRRGVHLQSGTNNVTAVFNFVQGNQFTGLDNDGTDNIVMWNDGASDSVESIFVENEQLEGSMKCSDGQAITLNSSNNIWECTDLTLSSDGWQSVYKTTDQTITLDSTLSNDADLFFNAEANSVYAFQIWIYFTTTANADFKYAFSEPSGAQGNSWGNADISPTTERAVVDTTITRSVPVGGSNDFAVYQVGQLITFGTGGNFSFQWAQDTNHADSLTLETGSWMQYKKLN